MSTVIPSIDIGRGLKMPIIGLGTWKPDLMYKRESNEREVENAVKDAIDAGYRHIDTAYCYQNEDQVGSAIAAKIAEGVVTREDIFLVTKLWNTFHTPEDVRMALKKSLEDLKMDYVDLYLIHWPVALKRGEELFPTDESGNFIFDDVHPTETYKAMEKLVEEGLVKHIGVSNFNNEQVQHILDNATIIPATNQIEVHPYLANREIVDFCHSKGISITSYGSLGSAHRPWVVAFEGEPILLEDSTLQSLATKYKRTVAQVILRWLVQNNIIVIPKSSNPGRLRQNFNIFDFELLKEDMELINSLDRNYRIAAPCKKVDGKRVSLFSKAPHNPHPDDRG